MNDQKEKIKENEKNKNSEAQLPSFEVEKILSERILRNNKMYLVKWKGFSEDENTWEPIENLQGCERILAKYILSTKDRMANDFQKDSGKASSDNK